MQILPFFLDEQRYALRADCVERVMRAVEITLLPQAPAIIFGVITIRGRIVPVVDVRRRFNLPPRKLSVHDVFVLAHTPRRAVVVIADAVHGVLEIPNDEVIVTKHIAPGTLQVAGIAKLPDGMIIIQDLALFLSLDEEEALDYSLRCFRGGEHA